MDPEERSSAYVIIEKVLGRESLTLIFNNSPKEETLDSLGGDRVSQHFSLSNNSLLGIATIAAFSYLSLPLINLGEKWLLPI